MAIPVPAQVAAALDRLLPALPSLRRVAPELMHVTLAFIGQVGEERVADVTEAVGVAALTSGPVPIDLSTVGSFPVHGLPRVVWAGAGPRAAEAIVRVGASVRAELLRYGVPLDPKPLRAHVTIARVREEASDVDARALAAAVTAARLGRELAFLASSVHVMESRLSSKGPLYSSRAEVPLVGPSR